MSKSKSSTKSLKKKLAQLEFSLGLARYKQAGYFPHPHWEEDEKRLLKEIAKIKEKLKV